MNVLPKIYLKCLFHLEGGGGTGIPPQKTTKNKQKLKKFETKEMLFIQGLIWDAQFWTTSHLLSFMPVKKNSRYAPFCSSLTKPPKHCTLFDKQGFFLLCSDTIAHIPSLYSASPLSRTQQNSVQDSQGTSR